jgi:hypothetical protein
VKEPYTVDNTSNQILVTVRNGASAFTMALQSNSTLLGQGSTDVVGRVVTGGEVNGLAFAPRSGRCGIGTLAAK